MPNTIEVPISLIQDGDLDAIRELLPKPNLNMPGHTPTKDERIVRRLVSQPEVMEP